MAHKQVLYRSEAREKILRGTAKLADAIRVTFGPRSKSILIEKKWGAPIVCNDGVTITKEFDLKDPEENLGARIRVALENAVSVASVLLLTEATTTELPEDKPKLPPHQISV